MSRNLFYFFIFLLIPPLLFFVRPIHVGDLAIWTALGRDSLYKLSLIIYDSYCFTATSEMIYSVLSSILYGYLYKIGDLHLVSFIHAFIASIWVCIWYRHLVKKAGTGLDVWNSSSFLVFTIALIGSSFVYIARPALLATVPLLLS
ncbi:MAG: hypothetical protein ABL930_09500 [Pseudobdellovibrio sp.]